MAKILAMYRAPKNAKAFEDYYFSKHVPLAKTLPGLRKYDVSVGGVGTPAGPSGYHLIATLYFDDMAAVEAAFASPQGQAAAGDIANFADGGVELVFFATKEI